MLDTIILTPQPLESYNTDIFVVIRQNLFLKLTLASN